MDLHEFDSTFLLVVHLLGRHLSFGHFGGGFLLHLLHGLFPSFVLGCGEFFFGDTTGGPIFLVQVGEFGSREERSLGVLDPAPLVLKAVGTTSVTGGAELLGGLSGLLLLHLGELLLDKAV